MPELDAQWKEGLWLSEACFDYASEHERSGYTYAVSHGGGDSRWLLMLAGLFDKLCRKELVAVGIRVSNEASGELEIIPAIHFCKSSLPALREALLENDCSLRFSGRRWDSIKIVQHAEVSASGVAVGYPREVAFVHKPTRTPSGKLGRPSVNLELDQIVGRLNCSRALLGKSRKEQINLVREEARTEFPDKFPKETQPSRPKILEALKKVTAVAKAESKKSK